MLLNAMMLVLNQNQNQNQNLNLNLNLNLGRLDFHWDFIQLFLLKIK